MKRTTATYRETSDIYGVVIIAAHAVVTFLSIHRRRNHQTFKTNFIIFHLGLAYYKSILG